MSPPENKIFSYCTHGTKLKNQRQIFHFTVPHVFGDAPGCILLVTSQGLHQGPVLSVLLFNYDDFVFSFSKFLKNLVKCTEPAMKRQDRNKIVDFWRNKTYLCITKHIFSKSMCYETGGQVSVIDLELVKFHQNELLFVVQLAKGSASKIQNITLS